MGGRIARRPPVGGDAAGVNPKAAVTPDCRCLGTGAGAYRSKATADNPCVLTPYVQQSNVARFVLDVSVGAFVVGEFSQMLRGRRGATRSNLGAEALFRAMFFGGILLIPVGRALAPDALVSGGVWVFFLGVLIGWLGLLLRWWCFMTLGKYFTVVLKTSEDQPVVERGPYRVLRHPSYTGLLLAIVGGGLMVGNWVSTAGSVALVLTALVYRIRIEERALNAALGDRYRNFAASRARLVPFLW
jgi:protein-S-isoprenylcysteine O-methyltransferase Ste14